MEQKNNQNRGTRLPYRRHIRKQWIYSEGSEELLSCDPTTLKQCLNKFPSEEFPKECQGEMDKFKLFCGLRRPYNVNRIRIRNSTLSL